jgi:hypothetical protein
VIVDYHKTAKCTDNQSDHGKYVNLRLTSCEDHTPDLIYTTVSYCWSYRKYPPIPELGWVSKVRHRLSRLSLRRSFNILEYKVAPKRSARRSEARMAYYVENIYDAQHNIGTGKPRGPDE